MGEKDITENTLADYNDVFADIVNVLLFDGEEVIHEDDLEAVGTKSQYKADTGHMHEQERDVSKLVKNGDAIISLIGFENQTKAEKYEPIRLLNYDGQSYRSQLLDKNAKRVYPVITIVLYFGTDHWNYSRHLTDLVDIPERFRQYVSDYEMKNLFEISYLTPDQVSKFKSDFRLVAECFVQNRMNIEYQPSEKEIEHIDALLKMMTVLTGDRSFEDKIAYANEQKQKGERVVMNDIFTRTVRHEAQKAEERGTQKGEVKVYYTKFHYTPEQISQEINVPENTVNDIIAELLKEKEEAEKKKYAAEKDKQ